MKNRKIKFLAGITFSAFFIFCNDYLPAFASMDFPYLSESEEKGYEYPWDENGFRIVIDTLVSFNGDDTSLRIPDEVKILGEKAFYPQGDKVETVIIPRNVISIGSECFLDCVCLNEVNFVVSYPYEESDLNIGSYAFKGCTGLEKINLSDDLNRIKEVGEGLFSGCTNLKDVTLSNGMTEIPDYMFKDCTSLKQIYIPENIEYISDNAFEGTSDLVIYCKEGSDYIRDYAQKNGIPVILTDAQEIVKQDQYITIAVDLPGNTIVRYLDDEDFYLNVSSSGNGSFSFFTDDTDIVTVNEQGLVSIHGVGTATVQINLSATDLYNSTQANAFIIIKDRNDIEHPTESPTEVPTENPTGDLSDNTGNSSDDNDSNQGNSSDDSNSNQGDSSDDSDSNQGDSSVSNSKIEQNVKLEKIEVTYGDDPFFIYAKSTDGKKITFSSSNKKVFTVNSKGKVKIKGYGFAELKMRSGSMKKEITIVVKPVRNMITSSYEKERKIHVTWNRDKKADGYYLYYSTDYKFHNNVKKIKISKNSTTDYTLKNLKLNKKYYIKICNYKKFHNKTILGDFSNISKIKVN